MILHLLDVDDPKVCWTIFQKMYERLKTWQEIFSPKQVVSVENGWWCWVTKFIFARIQGTMFTTCWCWCENWKWITCSNLTEWIPRKLWKFCARTFHIRSSSYFWTNCKQVATWRRNKGAQNLNMNWWSSLVEDQGALQERDIGG